MNENIKVRWLTDHEQTKVAPKTLSSQIYNEDGTLYKEGVEQSIADLKYQVENAQKPVNANWDQTDSTALDFIINRPFGSTGEYKETVIIENTKPFIVLTPGFYVFAGSSQYTGYNPLYKYKVILNGQEYICTPQKDSTGVYCLGNPAGSTNNLDLSSGFPDLSVLNWGDGEPFCLTDFILTTKAPYEDSYTLSVYQQEEIIKKLDKKYVDYLPGEKTTGNAYTYEEKDLIAARGAEIFNDYDTNIAIGTYSSAQGTKNVALGQYSHAEGESVVAKGPQSHAEGYLTIAEGRRSHAEGDSTEARGTGSHSEGQGTIAIGEYSHVQGRYNIPDVLPNYSQGLAIPSTFPEYEADTLIYLLEEKPEFDGDNGVYIITGYEEKTYKDLNVGDCYLININPETDLITNYFVANELISQRTDEATGKVYYQWNYYNYSALPTSPSGGGVGAKFAEIIGNGASNEERSNIYTLDWEGNAWYQGDVYVGSNSGVNKDEGSKKLATEDYVESLVKKLSATLALNFYCIEDVTIVTNGVSKVYPANSNVEIAFSNEDVFEIIPTSNNSILSLSAFPGALGTYYPWLEGVKQFSNILFDMNDEAMYSKWSQGNQGAYQVQFAQYKNCIFWSDNPYISDVARRTNYTLCATSELPLCYSTIPENTFKSFYLAFGANSDPNWSNSLYKESFAQATWATQAFSYYGARVVGYPGHDSSAFTITLPKDCRGLMFDARNIECAGTFDAVNCTNFGAKSGSWREAFGDCPSLRRLYIKNLKVNLNISWSPIDYASIKYIIDSAANTSKITISVSPYTYNLLSESDFELATSKNITIALITTNYVEDKRLSSISTKADKTYVDEAVAGLVGSAPEALNTLGELATALNEHQEVVDTLDAAITAKKNKDIIVTYAEGSHTAVTHDTRDLYDEIMAGTTVYFKKGTELLPVMEADPSYITFFMFYMNMNNQPQQKIVVITGNSVMMDQDDTYTYVTDVDLTEELGNYYNKVETEEYVNTAISNIENENVLLKTEQVLTDEELAQVKNNLRYIGKGVGGLTVTPYAIEELDYGTDNHRIEETPLDPVTAGEGAEVFNVYDGMNVASGAYSTAMGHHTIASGDYSFTNGRWTTASGLASKASGLLAYATGHYSNAEGTRTQATKNNCHAEGDSTTASGTNSHSEGLESTASGNVSHAEGWKSKATGIAAHAEGEGTIAAGRGQTAMGRWNVSDTSSKLIVGIGTNDTTRKNGFKVSSTGQGYFASDVYANDDKKLATEEFVNNVVANIEIPTNDNVLVKTEQTLTDEELAQVRSNLKFIGKDVEGQTFTIDGVEVTASANAEIFGDYTSNIATGQWAIAEGSGTIAKGRASHAEGAMTQALNDGTHTEGYQTKATGYWSHAEGEMTTVSSYASHAEGSYCTLPDGTKRYGTASGYASHVEGGGCHTTGSCTHAEGLATTASGAQSHVEGRYTIAAGAAQHVEGVANIEDAESNYIHIAGNGTFDARSNAYALDWDGNGWFSGDVYVGSTSGTNKDEGSKKLATEEYVDNKEYDFFILKSSTPGSNKKFKITIDDDGILSSEEVTE